MPRAPSTPPSTDPVTMMRASKWDISPVAGKSPVRVLVVDDEHLIRWSLTELLGECGCRVAEAGDGRSALEALAHGFADPDVVVLDLRLPDTDDLTLVAAVRRAAPRARIILMTAFDTPEVLENALDLGVFRVVPKPFEMHEMVRLVHDAHGSAKAQ